MKNIFDGDMVLMEPRESFDEAIIGQVMRFNQEFVLYDHDKVIEILMSEGMSYDDALEHWSHNMVGSWVGEHTWGFLMTKT